MNLGNIPCKDSLRDSGTNELWFVGAIKANTHLHSPAANLHTDLHIGPWMSPDRVPVLSQNWAKRRCSGNVTPPIKSNGIAC